MKTVKATTHAFISFFWGISFRPVRALWSPRVKYPPRHHVLSTLFLSLHSIRKTSRRMPSSRKKRTRNKRGTRKNVRKPIRLNPNAPIKNAFRRSPAKRSSHKRIRRISRKRPLKGGFLFGSTTKKNGTEKQENQENKSQTEVVAPDNTTEATQAQTDHENDKKLEDTSQYQDIAKKYDELTQKYETLMENFKKIEENLAELQKQNEDPQTKPDDSKHEEEGDEKSEPDGDNDEDENDKDDDSEDDNEDDNEDGKDEDDNEDGKDEDKNPKT